VGLRRNELTKSELGVKLSHKTAQNDPLISTLDVKMTLNIVNIPETTPIFPLQAGLGFYYNPRKVVVVKV